MDIQSLLKQVKQGDDFGDDGGTPDTRSSKSKSDMKPDELASLLTQEAFQNDPQLEAMIQEFSMRMASQQNKQTLDEMGMVEIEPLPGFVIKTKLTAPCEDFPADLKVFINICHSSLVPSPPPISKEDLQEVIQSGDSSSYRIPLSLSPSQTDYDKVGNICLVFDACVNSDTLEMALKDNDFKIFLMVLAVEWVEEKHKLQLAREFSLPKMKAKGALRKQTIRKTRKPIIADVTEKKKGKTGVSNQAVPITQKPEFEVFKEPLDHPEYVVVQVALPDLDSTSESVLEVEEGRFMFLTPGKYQLDLLLDVSVDIGSAVAQFDRSSRKLNVTMKVLTRS